MHYPKHLAIIPDGCRRWAQDNNLPPWEGHRRGIEVLEDLGKWSVSEFPIKYYTVYGLSIENLNRARIQLKALEKLYAKHFLRLSEDDAIHENKVRIDIIGRWNLIPKKVQDAIEVARERTADYDNIHFRIALAYSGRLEIVDAVRKIIEDDKKITEENISKNMYSDAPEPDLIIRTAETRMSNFLLWEGAYSELFFLDKYWPDFTKEDFKKALDDFNERQRRYGK